MCSLSLTIPLLALSSLFCWGEEEAEGVFRASFVSLIPGVNLLVWEAHCVKEEEFLTTWGETAWSSLSSGFKILPSSCVVVFLHYVDGGKSGDSDPTCIIQN